MLIKPTNSATCVQRFRPAALCAGGATAAAGAAPPYRSSCLICFLVEIDQKCWSWCAQIGANGLALLEGLPRLLALRPPAVVWSVWMPWKLTKSADCCAQIGANGLAPLEGLPRLRALRLQLQPLSSPAADPEGYRTAARSLATTLPKLQVLSLPMRNRMAPQPQLQCL